MDDHYLEDDCLEIFKQWNLCGATSHAPNEQPKYGEYVWWVTCGKTSCNIHSPFLCLFLQFLCFICRKYIMEGRLVCDLAAETDCLSRLHNVENCKFCVVPLTFAWPSIYQRLSIDFVGTLGQNLKFWLNNANSEIKRVRGNRTVKCNKRIQLQNF
jgi:hypothetical protein